MRQTRKGGAYGIADTPDGDGDALALSKASADDVGVVGGGSRGDVEFCPAQRQRCEHGQI